jgi:hypothetical protein
MVQGVRPQSKMHCRRLSSTCMQQSFLRALAEVADCTLGDSILEVGIHATEGETLMAVVACLTEGIVGETSIITVVVLDAYTVLGSKGLKRLLSC